MANRKTKKPSQIKAQTGGKKSVRKNKKRNLRKNKKSFKKRKQKGGELIKELRLLQSREISNYLTSRLTSLEPKKRTSMFSKSSSKGAEVSTPEVSTPNIIKYFDGITNLNTKVSDIEDELSSLTQKVSMINVDLLNQNIEKAQHTRESLEKMLKILEKAPTFQPSTVPSYPLPNSGPAEI